MAVPPLTKQTPNGVLYVRPPIVQTNIEGAQALDLASLKARLAVTDSTSAAYLRSETLVHLIRQAMRRSDEAVSNALVPVLLDRCEINLKAKIPVGHLPNAAAIQEEVLSQFGELLASDGQGENPDELDIFECKFNMALRTFRIDLVRSEMRHVNRIAEPADTEEDEQGSDDEVFAKVSEAGRTPAIQEGTIFRNKLSVAINALPEDERKAVILVHVMGYDEESDDPDKVTAATICGCTGRTIRNRLTRAAKKLSTLKEEL